MQAKSHRDQEAPDSPSATRQAAWRDQPNAPIRDLSLAGIHDILSLQSTIGNRIVSGILADRPAVSRRPPSPLRDLLSNSAASKPALHVQRDEDAGSSADPKKHSSYGSWLQSMPADAIDYTAVDVTGKIAAELPDLADLVTDLKADCADVTILLKHYYLQAHGQTQTMKSIDPKDRKKTVDYKIGAGISRKDLRLALVYLGTVSFQEKGRSRLAFVRLLWRFKANKESQGDHPSWTDGGGCSGLEETSWHQRQLLGARPDCAIHQPLRSLAAWLRGASAEGQHPGPAGDHGVG